MSFLQHMDLYTGLGKVGSSVRDICVFYIYLILLIGWGISFNKRIRSPQILVYLNLILTLMVFWLIVRTLKWHFTDNFLLETYLWYSYYVPMILIPMLHLFAVSYAHRPEDYTLNKKFFILPGIAFVLILLVYTNNFHSLLFRFTGNDIDHYTYGALYVVILIWSSSIYMFSLFFLSKKCEKVLSGSKRYFPYCFLALVLIYFVSYFYHIFPGSFLELIAAYNWLIIISWESCVHLDMIPINKYHRQFFGNSNLRFVIIDREGRICDRSKDVMLPEKEDMKKLMDDHVLQKGESRYHLYPISCGYIIWQEDISEISELMEQLKADEKDLEARNTLITEEIKARNKREKICETNRLYSMLMTEMEGALQTIGKLTDELGDDIEKNRLTLAHIDLIGVYLKRRSNLIMIAEAGQDIEPDEISGALRETFNNLKYFGIDCDYKVTITSPLSKDCALETYDYLQRILEIYYLSAKKLRLSIFENAGSPMMSIKIDDQTAYEFDMSEGGAS